MIKLCVCVCDREAAEREEEEDDEERDTESKTRTPHKDVGNCCFPVFCKNHQKSISQISLKFE